jgi:hypothetical protein
MQQGADLMAELAATRVLCNITFQEISDESAKTCSTHFAC